MDPNRKQDIALMRYAAIAPLITGTQEVFTETEFAQLKREPYIQAPPEGYTADEIRTMSDDAILDMDYFLNE